MFRSLAALAAVALLTCAPALAQDVRTLPAAGALTGTEKLPAVQGAGCATKTTPCATVAVTPAAVATFLAPTFEAKDADLDAIAALTTQPFGRSLLTQADASAARTTLGLGSAALASTGTSGATVPLLSGANSWSGAQAFAAVTATGGVTQDGTAAILAKSSANNAAVLLSPSGATGEGWLSSTNYAASVFAKLALRAAAVSIRPGGTEAVSINGPLGNYASDSAAASGGVPINGLYRNGSVVMIRVN
jgi:hypothetical protein